MKNAAFLFVALLAMQSSMAFQDVRVDNNSTRQPKAGLALALAPIRSAVDLERHLKLAERSKSPFFALSTTARTRFLSSLTFNEKGLTSFRYEELEAELAPSQIRSVLALFGAQRATPMFRNAKAVSHLDRQILGTTYLAASTSFSDGEFGSSDYYWDEWGDPFDAGRPDYKDMKCLGTASCMRAPKYLCTEHC